MPIASFRSRALKRYWERNDPSKLPPDRTARIRMILLALEVATEPSDLNIPGFGFHQLGGDQRGRYAVSVSGNWRITFGWHEGDANLIDFEDCH